MTVTSIILAAGEGKRLGNLTKKIPKCLVPIFGKSLLERNLEIFKRSKIKKIIVIGGYKSHLLKSKNYTLLKNNEFQSSNMLWSLFKAKSKLNGNVIISYGDIVFSSELLRRMIKSKKNISVAIDKKFLPYWKKRFKNPYQDLESLKITKSKITSIGKKINKNSIINGQYIGLIKLNKKGCKIFKKIFYNMLNKTKLKEFKRIYLTAFLQLLIDAGYKIHPITFNDDWIEIDTIKDTKSSYTLQRLKKIK